MIDTSLNSPAPDVVVSVEEYTRLTRLESKLSHALLCPKLAVGDHDFLRNRDTGRSIKP